MVPSNRTQSGETPYPLKTGRRSHADGLRKSIVGDASILLQNTHDGEVNSVEMV